MLVQNAVWFYIHPTEKEVNVAGKTSVNIVLKILLKVENKFGVYSTVELQLGCRG
jgi:hypothetical protein